VVYKHNWDHQESETPQKEGRLEVQEVLRILDVKLAVKDVPL
jgi:hypothetical protein